MIPPASPVAAFRRLRRWLGVAVLLLAAAPALAADSESIACLLKDGRFEEAAERGERIGDALGLTLAAEALAYEARCNYRDDPKRQMVLFARAQHLAQRATELAPDSAEAWLQRARSHAWVLGLSRESLSTREKLDQVAKLDKTIGRAVMLDPNNAVARMMRGRIEVGKLAESRRALLGLFSALGDRELALSDLCAAIRLTEEDPVIPRSTLVYYTVAEGLWTLDEQRYARLAAKYLERSLAPCEGDAVCRCLQGPARRLLGEVRAAITDKTPPAEPLCGAP